MNKVFSFVDSNIKKVGNTTYCLFDDYFVDFSKVVGFRIGDKKLGYCGIHFYVVFSDQKDMLIKHVTSEYNIMATKQMVKDFPEFDYDDYNQYVLNRLIQDTLCPLMEKLTSTNH